MAGVRVACRRGHGGIAVRVAVRIVVPRRLGGSVHGQVIVVRERVAVLVHVERIAHLGGTGVDRDVGVVAVGVVHDVARRHAARRGGRRGVPVRVAVGVREVGGAAARLVHGVVAVVVHGVAHLGRAGVDGHSGVVAVRAHVEVVGDRDVVLRLAADGEVDAHVVRVAARVVGVDVRRLGDDGVAILVVVEAEHGAHAVRGTHAERAAADALRRSLAHVAVLRVDVGVGLRGAAGEREHEPEGQKSETHGEISFPW